MPITHNIKSPVTLAAADITEAEIANGAVTDSKVNFSNSIAVGNSTVNTSLTNQTIITYAPITSKNIFINGGMNVWQRSANATSLTSTGYHTADRWQFYRNNVGTWTNSRSTDVPTGQGFGYSLKINPTVANTSPGASTGVSLQQRIEGQNLQHLLKGTSSAKAITMSFWVKSNKTGTYIVTILDLDNSRQIAKAYTIDSASTWEKKTITFEGDTTGTIDNDNAGSFLVSLQLQAGSSYTTGTLATSWESWTNNLDNRAVGQVNLADSTSNEWYITGVQLEVGDTATGFEFEPYSTIFNKCTRYFYFINHDLEGTENWDNSVVMETILAPNGEFRDAPTSIEFVNTSGGGTWATSSVTRTGFRMYNAGTGNGKTAQVKIDAEL